MEQSIKKLQLVNLKRILSRHRLRLIINHHQSTAHLYVTPKSSSIGPDWNSLIRKAKNAVRDWQMTQMLGKEPGTIIEKLMERMQRLVITLLFITISGDKLLTRKSFKRMQ